MSKRFNKLIGLVALTICQPAAADLVEKSTTSVVESADITMSLLKVTGGLLMVIVAIFGSAWLYRRFSNMPPIANNALRIIGGVSMGQKERVVLMQVGEEQILLGVSPGRIQRLHVLEKNIEIPVEASGDKSFAAQMNAALKRNTITS